MDRKTNRGAVKLTEYLLKHPDVPQWQVGKDCGGANQATVSRWKDGILKPKYAARAALAAWPYSIRMDAWDKECKLPKRFAKPTEPAAAQAHTH
jgi:hypothetical protein